MFLMRHHGLMEVNTNYRVVNYILTRHEARNNPVTQLVDISQSLPFSVPVLIQ